MPPLSTDFLFTCHGAWSPRPTQRNGNGPVAGNLGAGHLDLDVVVSEDVERYARRTQRSGGRQQKFTGAARAADRVDVVGEAGIPLP
jgi:hypothetical protein